ncbi:amino acid permease [Streptomyces griseoaurantiacus]|uniref:Amino acid permease n=1 Tax=Streptomyces griseoaurantiacus TaxID=68213 RepID=A0A7W2DX95_9ACTN|nr:amino acid permease [Streptomyces griseoaurantiacus]MBA5224562.1 amino acid permease [Streptomyces griseoaurantiacus]
MSHSRAGRLLPGADDDVLAALGIKPELSRRMSPFGNFAISFSVICILAGGMSLFGFGLGHGGPVSMLGSWVVVGLMTLLVGCSLADVVSAYPTSGGPYFMADKLGGPRWGWVTGWLNLLGLLGAIAGIDYGAAAFAGAFAQLQWGIAPTEGTTMTIFAAILLMHGTLNSRGVRLVNLLNSISVWWQLAGVTAIVGALTLAPAQHQSARFVFTHFHNDTGFTNPLYVCLIGALVAGYTFCGYDASAHVAEETTNAQTSAPRGIVRAIWVSWVAGFVLLAGLLFALQDYTATQNTATGVPPAQIFLDVLGTGGAKTLLLVVIIAMLFCGNAEVAACSRMVYAFSRSRALPGWQNWRRVSTRTKTPTRAVWFAVVVPFLLALPALWSPAAYGAITAINAVGMTPAYGIPVYLSLRKGRHYTPGPWTLGRWRRPVGITAVLYVVCITVIFCLPQSTPVTVDSFNYAGLTLAIALLLAWITWMTRGRRTYQLTASHTAQPSEALLSEGI